MMSEDENRHIQRVAAKFDRVAAKCDRVFDRAAAKYSPIIRHAQREAAKYAMTLDTLRRREVAKRDAPAHHLPLYSYLPAPAHPREWQSPHNAEIDERPRRPIGFAPWS